MNSQPVAVRIYRPRPFFAAFFAGAAFFVAFAGLLAAFFAALAGAALAGAAFFATTFFAGAAFFAAALTASGLACTAPGVLRGATFFASAEGFAETDAFFCAACG
jgi:hypothetical protein